MIRPATKQDIPQMVDIGAAFHDASGYPKYGVKYSGKKLAESLDQWIDSGDHIVMVAENDGVVVGVASAVKSVMYMTEDAVAVETFWWVNPDQRGQMHSIRLLHALENWAKNSGAVALCMISLGEIDGPADDIYDRKGYSLAERFWIKRF